LNEHNAGLSLDKLLHELNYPQPVEMAVRRKLADRNMRETADSAYVGEGLDFALCRRMPLTRLAAVTLLLLQKYKAYRGIRASDEIIFDTFRDVSLRAELYYNATGESGIRKDDVIWFRHIMNVNIFKIGVMQFQPFEMLYLDEEMLGEPYMKFDPVQKASLPVGTSVINCHVQQGADLTPQKVRRALHDAEAFFKNHFPDVRFRAFLCYSWLLYPPMLCSLSERSNIRQFSELFDVVGFCGDNEQAMESLFPNGKRKALPTPTSLQAAALAHPEQFGFACGIRKL